MIPSFITREDVLEALRLIRQEGVPRRNRSHKYCLVENDRHYPPKYVISRAHEVATGRRLPTSDFSGGQQASNRFLRLRHFRVSDCGGDCGQVSAYPTDAGAQRNHRLRVRPLRQGCASRDISENEDVEVPHIVRALSDPRRAQDPRKFPTDSDAAENAGLYSWWVDPVAQRLFAGLFGGEGIEVEYHHSGYGLALVYIGQTGNLKSRIQGDHISGNVKSSTFRETISSILFEHLNLSLDEAGRLVLDDNRRVSTWIKDHLRVAIAPLVGGSLEGVERVVLRELDPPFNLDKVSSSRLRQRLRELRKRIRDG